MKAKHVAVVSSVMVLAVLSLLIIRFSGESGNRPDGVIEGMDDLKRLEEGETSSAVKSKLETREELESAELPNISNISYEGRECGSARASFASGSGPVTLLLRGSASFSSIYAAKDGGRKHGDLLSLRSSDLPLQNEFEVPTGKFGELSAKPMYDVYHFRFSNEKGEDALGRAAIFSGYCYKGILS